MSVKGGSTGALGYSGGSHSNPAYDDPQVKKTLQKLHLRIQHAERMSGDIKKDIHQRITIPYFIELRENDRNYYALHAGGNTVKSGRVLPSSQYGWLTQKYTNTYVDAIIKMNRTSIVDDTRLAKHPTNSLSEFKRRFGNAIRHWWCLERDKLIPKYWNERADHLNSPEMQEAFRNATKAKLAGKSVPQYLGTGRRNAVTPLNIIGQGPSSSSSSSSTTNAPPPDDLNELF